MLSLRPATTSDASFVWECRNDVTALAMSGSTGEIPYHQHSEWFAQHSTEFQIGQTSDGVPVGYGRLAKGVIGVAVHPLLRSLGFGSQIIALVSDQSSSLITAWIRPDNIASQRAFAFCGYHQVDSTELLERWEYRP